MCFDGSARIAAHKVWCTTATSTTTSTVPMRPPTCLTGRPGPWPVTCGVLLLQPQLFWVWLSRYPSKTSTFVRCISGKSPRLYNIRYDALCKCRIKALVPLWVYDTPCRLGDAGGMTFLPWFVPRTETPVQLREVGPEMEHLLTQSCSDFHLHVWRCRTGEKDRCCCSVGSRRQYITACAGVIFAR